VIGARARDIPFDPSQSKDVVLRVGYQTLRTAMSQRTTLIK
jgi:hypothetical protein